MDGLKSDKSLIGPAIATIEVFFDSLVTRSITELQADKETSVISDVGGQLGLWLGISFVSLFELAYCLATMCCKGKRPVPMAKPEKLENLEPAFVF